MQLKAGPLAATVLASLFCALSAAARQLNEPRLVLDARKCQVVVYTEWNRNDAGFSQKAEVAEVFAAVTSSGLYRNYTGTSAAHADLILKIDDDALWGHVTLDVLNPDDNSVVYHESRDRVAVDNDVKRLVEHFLHAVDEARESDDEANRTNSADQGESDDKLPTSSQTVAAGTTTDDGSLGYIFVGRFEREDRAQSAAKKIEDLGGLRARVVPKQTATGKAFVVVTGPFAAKSLKGILDWLQAQGFADASAIRTAK